MKLRTGEPFMPADQVAHALHGLSINLLVRDVQAALAFQRVVLGATVVYADPDFAVLRGYGSEWMVHADHAYEGHPMRQAPEPDAPRGPGVELRLHGCDPDAACDAARRHGYFVLAPPTDKPHGLRETHIVDTDGYIWVPDVAVPRAG